MLPSFPRKTAILGVVCLLAHVTPASADPFERGIQGAIGGAIVGGVLKGKKGVGKGAAIGATVGILGGALEERNRRRYEQNYIEPDYSRPKYYTYSSETVADIQSELARLGYNPGVVDGVYGHRTALAIGDYQREHGLLVTQKPSRALLKHMYKNGG